MNNPTLGKILRKKTTAPEILLAFEILGLKYKHVGITEKDVDKRIDEYDNFCEKNGFAPRTEKKNHEISIEEKRLSAFANSLKYGRTFPNATHEQIKRMSDVKNFWFEEFARREVDKKLSLYFKTCKELGRMPSKKEFKYGSHVYFEENFDLLKYTNENQKIKMQKIRYYFSKKNEEKIKREVIKKTDILLKEYDDYTVLYKKNPPSENGNEIEKKIYCLIRDFVKNKFATQQQKRKMDDIRQRYTRDYISIFSLVFFKTKPKEKDIDHALTVVEKFAKENNRPPNSDDDNVVFNMFEKIQDTYTMTPEQLKKKYYIYTFFTADNHGKHTTVDEKLDCLENYCKEKGFPKSKSKDKMEISNYIKYRTLYCSVEKMTQKQKERFDEILKKYQTRKREISKREI